MNGETRHKTVVAHARLPAGTFHLLEQISKATKLKKGTLIRAAVSQWLKNAPPDLPLELKVAIAHQVMHDNIETIKQLRWIYYAAHDALTKLRYSEKHTGEKQSFPPHARKALRQLERNIVQQQNMLDKWLKQTFPMLADVANVANVYTDTEEP